MEDEKIAVITHRLVNAMKNYSSPGKLMILMIVVIVIMIAMMLIADDSDHDDGDDDDGNVPGHDDNGVDDDDVDDDDAKDCIIDSSFSSLHRLVAVVDGTTER